MKVHLIDKKAQQQQQSAKKNYINYFISAIRLICSISIDTIFFKLNKSTEYPPIGYIGWQSRSRTVYWRNNSRNFHLCNRKCHTIAMSLAWCKILLVKIGNENEISSLSTSISCIQIQQLLFGTQWILRKQMNCDGSYYNCPIMAVHSNWIELWLLSESSIWQKVNSSSITNNLNGWMFEWFERMTYLSINQWICTDCGHRCWCGCCCCSRGFICIWCSTENQWCGLKCMSTTYNSDYGWNWIRMQRKMVRKSTYYAVQFYSTLRNKCPLKD